MPTILLNINNIKSTRKTYDDNPIADDICHKIFPSVSYGGYSYMFLWFCPMHGHSYGFHIISGSEGRKDAFSSLHKYKPHAPSDIFMTLHVSYVNIV